MTSLRTSCLDSKFRLKINDSFLPRLQALSLSLSLSLPPSFIPLFLHSPLSQNKPPEAPVSSYSASCRQGNDDIIITHLIFSFTQILHPAPRHHGNVLGPQ